MKMKRKAAFWVVMILVNAIIGVASVRTYQNMDARITFLEGYQKNLLPYLFRDAKKLEQLESAHKKTTDALLRILGVDGKYDFNNNLVRSWDLNKFFEHKAYARTSVVLEVSDGIKELNADLPKKLTKKVATAPAVVIGRYVLMASHTNDVKLFSRQTVRIITPFGTLEQIFKPKVLKYNVALLTPNGSELMLKELYRNKEKDFSLFEIPVSRSGRQENVESLNFPFEIGRSHELKIGNFIYMNGQPNINSEVVRPGFVTSLVRAISDGELGVKKDSNEFGISQSTDEGDSGSPIMAFRDGRAELVGIYLGWIGLDSANGKNTRSRALKINIAVDEIKAKLGIDLRELQFQNLYKFNSSEPW